MVYTYTGDRVLTSQKLTAKITAEGGAINADATISYSAEKYTDLKALPAQLPEIPAFDPDDWFGKPGNPEIPDVTVSDEIGGHVYSLEFVDVECEEGADPAVVA